MMAERGIEVDHSTVHRWAIKILPASRDKVAAQRYFEKSINQHGLPQTVTIDASSASLAALEARQRQTRETRQGPPNEVSESHRGAGPSRHQMHRQTDDGLRGFPLRLHHPLGCRISAHDPERPDERQPNSAHCNRSVLLLPKCITGSLKALVLPVPPTKGCQGVVMRAAEKLSTCSH
ncbi:hypothetical protein OKW42_000014 [Paraburkholderia sp. WC7.3d]